MSDICTLLTLPNSKYSGFMARGRWMVKDVIAEAREQALRDRNDAEACLCALDSDFEIELVRGNIIQHPIAVLQKARDRWDSSNPTGLARPATEGK